MLPDINSTEAHPLPCNNNHKNNWLVSVSPSADMLKNNRAEFCILSFYCTLVPMHLDNKAKTAMHSHFKGIT